MTAGQRYDGSGLSRPDDPEAIRAGINETRERISQDLDEIGDRLNPHSIKEEIKDGIREATIGRVEEMARNAGERLNGASSGIVQTIRMNPVPAAVTAVGLTWLLMSRNQGGGSRSAYNPAPQTGTIDKAKDRVTALAGQAQETVSNVATPQVQSLRNAFYENPIALATGALALGIAVGLLAPATPSEKRIIGDVGDTVVQKVSEVARDAGDKAQHVAQRAFEEATTAAREEGLASTGGQQQGNS